MKITFLGTACVLIEYLNKFVLIDGFFSRPTLLEVVATRLKPNRERISQVLEMAGVKRLEAVLVTHSHYDHAIDAAEIALQTDSTVIGSLSTAHLARGWHLPEEHIQTIKPNVPLNLDPFQVRFIPSRHANPLAYPGQIAEPIRFPAPAAAFREGGTFAVEIVTQACSIVVLGSAGFLPGMFTGLKDDAIFISVAGLDQLNDDQLKLFFQETVIRCGARLVVPIHWDNFFEPLTHEAKYLPAPFENIRQSLNRLEHLCRSARIAYHFPHPCESFDPLFDVK